ncbi:MAG: transcriptional repressor NrdR [Alphaproteobacteria bacterium]|nr:transcriptional repressor NrdR [Alphaproteobacteria bacterium]
MKCPFCGCPDTQVKDSRPNEDATMIRRRRECPKCHARFTTSETVQLRELIVIKKDGSRKPFDRDKLLRSIVLAVRKRDVTLEQVEQLVNNIVRSLEQSGEAEIQSAEIGRYAMQSLLSLDKVAYIRYASVYKNFTTTRDFEDFVKNLTGRRKKV